MSKTDPASIRVVREVAAREGVDPTDLEPPLYEVIDPDALDALFQPRDAAEPVTTVEFTYCGHRVRVHGPGTVDVNAQAADRSGSAAVELER